MRKTQASMYKDLSRNCTRGKPLQEHASMVNCEVERESDILSAGVEV